MSTFATILSIALVGAVLGASVAAISGLVDILPAGAIVGVSAGVSAWLAGVRTRPGRTKAPR